MGSGLQLIDSSGPAGSRTHGVVSFAWGLTSSLKARAGVASARGEQPTRLFVLAEASLEWRRGAPAGPERDIWPWKSKGRPSGILRHTFAAYRLSSRWKPDTGRQVKAGFCARSRTKRFVFGSQLLSRDARRPFIGRKKRKKQPLSDGQMVKIRVVCFFLRACNMSWTLWISQVSCC